jgi:serine protease inhibitor
LSDTAEAARGLAVRITGVASDHMSSIGAEVFMSIRPFSRLASLAVATTMVACADRTTEPSPAARAAALTALPRALTPAERGVLDASNAYSFALWRTINGSSRDSNVFVSPLSASFALGMTMNGANGQTYDEMRSALQFGDASLASIDTGYRSLIALLTSIDPSTTMQIANAIFYRNDFPFNQSFLTDASTYFGAEVKAQDFTNTQATLAAVNGWSSAKTHDRIPKILDAVDPSTVMYLLNAIYFKGIWRDQFEVAQTRDAPFHAVSGDQPARLMHREGAIDYAETNALQAVDLPYGDSAFTMTVLLPKAGSSVESVAASLTPDTWRSLAASFHPRDVELFLPKVTLSWKRGLIPDMQALGMRAAFGNADFTRMSPRGRELVISLLQQNTFVDIDEEGTEAAAVTIVGVALTSAPVATPVRVDRPFVFVIRERLSGTVLFMGKITRLPSA